MSGDTSATTGVAWADANQRVLVAEFARLKAQLAGEDTAPAREAIEEITPEEFEHTFRTNVFAMFYLCRAALPRMKPGSCVINTASIQAFDPSANLLAYAPTKAAIVNRMGTLVFGEEDEELEHAIIRLLHARRASLATAESGTGGLLAHRITVKPELWMTEVTGARVVDEVLGRVATPATLEATHRS